jgi:hypothetical protein
VEKNTSARKIDTDDYETEEFPVAATGEGVTSIASPEPDILNRAKSSRKGGHSSPETLGMLNDAASNVKRCVRKAVAERGDNRYEVARLSQQDRNATQFAVSVSSAGQTKCHGISQSSRNISAIAFASRACNSIYICFLELKDMTAVRQRLNVHFSFW